MTTTAIDTVIFDWGGVLIDDPAPMLLSVFSRTLGVPADEFIAAIKRHAEPFQKGTWTETQFWRQICADLKVSPPKMASLWGAAFHAIYLPKEGVWTLARSLKQAGFKIGLLSNTEMPGVDYFHACQPHIFDAMIFSCCEHCRKPEPRIYELALERLKAQPDRALFIDDNAHYIEGARAVGLHTIQFKSVRSLLRELTSLGIRVEG